jgi:MFS family permease
MQHTMGDGRRKLLVAFAVLQNVFVGGIVFGWAGIAGTVLIAPEQDGGAGLTLDQTTDIFAMAAFFASFSSLPLGIVLDKWGPRVASFLSIVIIGIGIQTMASARSYKAFAAGTCLTAFGGPGVQMSTVHLANLFPDNLFFVMSFVNGSISCSFAILPIFSMLWETYGIGIRPMFQAYLLVVFASALGSLLFWPDSPYETDDSGLNELLLTPKTRRTPFPPASPQKMVKESTKHTHLIEQPLDSYLRSNESKLNRHESFLVSRKALEEGQVSLVGLKDSPFRKQLASGSYIRMLVIFVATSFFANFYIASITTEVSCII